MSRLSIARSLLLALVGLTVALAVVAGLAVSSLYDTRQEYEEILARSYAAEVAGAYVLTASVVEESVLRNGRAAAADRARARTAFAQATAGAERAAAGDARSERLVRAIAAAESRARRARRRPAALGRSLSDARDAARQLAARQDERRATAREEAGDQSQRASVLALVAGGLAVGGAVALVYLLVAGLRRPLAELVNASRRVASGDSGVRVQSGGPAELEELSSAFNTMAGDLELARARIEAERARLETTIESLGDALVVCDAYGRIEQVNPRARELVPELAPGRDLSADPGFMPPLGDALEGEVEVTHGRRILAVTAARMGPGREDGVVWTVRDTTERARLERAKSEFVATASHELRSPLTSIKGFVELLAAGDLPPRQREFVDVILLSTNRLVDLVNDLLDVARVEAGRLEVQRRAIAIGEAVREVATLMRPRIEEKGQTLEVEIAPTLPAAYADPGRIRQIVTNLLTNAHLYTQQDGRITLRVGALGDHVVLSVSDNGRGMTGEQLDRLFERFYRGAGTPTAPGTGLGMAIVKSLVDLHEGEISVESELAKGTTITVRIPRAPVAADLESPRDAIRGKRVLVVEDDPEVGRLVTEQLRPFEVDVVLARDAQIALERLDREDFDAVTLDILLGDRNGFEVLQHIRDDPRLRRLPVLVVSVLAGEETLAGEWSISKPIEADELTDALGAAILAGRARVLVVGRAMAREEVGGMLHRRGIEYVWATSAAEAARLCEEHRFEVALVDADMRSPQAALAQLDLRGRRLRRSVVVFSTDNGTNRPSLARLDPDPVPVEDATQAVVQALSGGQ